MHYENGEIDYKKNPQLSFGNKLFTNDKSNYLLFYLLTHQDFLKK